MTDRQGTEAGQTTAEYAALVGFFAVVVVAGFILLRGISGVFDRGGTEVGTFRPPVVECDANYEGGCVPPSPPKLDCDDLAELGLTRVTVVGPDDPHELDPDGDGIACD